MTTDVKITEHYKTPTHYQNRMGTMNYITRNDSLWQWLAAQYDLSGTKKLLDIGCGDGEVWENLENKLPADTNIFLGDYSEGMLEASGQRIVSKNYKCHFAYQQMDICHIPFNDHFFDTIFAHLVLYHASSMHQALRELKRVLQPGGVLGIATLSLDACAEIYELIHEIEPRIQPHTYSAPFAAEVARSVLPKYFSSVTEKIYQADMVFDSSDPIITFLKSLEPFHPITVDECFYQECRERISKIIQDKQSLKTEFTASLFLCKI